MLIAETGFFRKLNRSILLIISLSILSSCADELSSSFKKSLSIVTPKKVDFKELEYYAKRSKSAYDPTQDIRKTYPLVTRAVTLQSIDVRYFIETNQAGRTQTLSIRGTAVRENVWEDIETTLSPDSILGIPLHSGFQRDAKAIYEDATPHLRKDFGLRITGHSLGGAAAAILADYYEQEGYDIERVVTFGQPKYTSKQPSKRVVSVSTRVVNELDVVPMVPAFTLAREYQHFDSEVILRDGLDYVYMSIHDAERLSAGEFWRHITDFSAKDHHMDGYLSNIEGKVSGGARQVQYFSKVKRESRNVAAFN